MSEFYSDSFQFVCEYFKKCYPKLRRNYSYLIEHRNIKLSFFDLLKQLILKSNLMFELDYGKEDSPAHRGDKGYAGFYSSYRNTIAWDFSDAKTLKHEVGHALDRYLNKMTVTHKLESFNKTFFEVLIDELKDKYHIALDALFEQMKALVEKKFGLPGSFIFDRIKPYFSMHARFYTIDAQRKDPYECNVYPLLRNEDEALREETKILKILTDVGYVERVLTIFEGSNNIWIASTSGISTTFNNQILVDLLSCRFNFKPFSLCYGHGIAYYSKDIVDIPSELFAELFEDYIPEDDVFKSSEDLFYTHFPNTVKAFKELYTYAFKTMFDDSFVHEDKITPVNMSYCYKTLDSIYNEEPQEFKKRKFKAGLEDALASNKQASFLKLSQREKEFLYDSVLSILESRSKLFKFMFGEKFKYQTYLDFKKKMTPQSMIYTDLYILNQKLGKFLHKQVEDELKYNYKFKNKALTQEEKDNILSALVFR